VATQLVPRALKLVPPDSNAAGRLLSRYGWELGRFQRNHEGAREAFSQALAIAHRDKDVVLEMWTLARSAHVDYLHCCYEEAIGKGLQSLELANRLDIPQAGGLALSSIALTLMTVGDPSGARHGEAALEISKRLCDRNEQPQLLLVALSWSLVRGDWHNAQVLIDRALAISPNDPVFPTYKGLLACELGDFQQGETILGQVINTLGCNPGDATARRAHIAISIALAARITGQSSWASSTEALAESVFSIHETPRIFRIAIGAQALLAILKKEDTSVAKQYASLESARSTLLGANIVADRLLGLLAQTLGNLDKATEHFEEALIFCRNAGYRPGLAWTCYDYAEVLLQYGHPGDHARAMSLLDEWPGHRRRVGDAPLS
jgi:tetratricopeptide (TPR) repeat protein